MNVFLLNLLHHTKGLELYISKTLWITQKFNRGPAHSTGKVQIFSAAAAGLYFRSMSIRSATTFVAFENAAAMEAFRAPERSQCTGVSSVLPEHT